MTKTNTTMLTKADLKAMISKIAYVGYEEILKERCDTFTRSLILKGDEKTICDWLEELLDDWNEETGSYQLCVDVLSVYEMPADVKQYDITLTYDTPDPEWEDEYEDKSQDKTVLAELIDPATLPQRPSKKLTDKQRATMAESKRLAAERFAARKAV